MHDFSSIPFPVTLEPTPEISFFDEYAYSNDTKNVKIHFEHVPDGATIHCQVYNHTLSEEKWYTLANGNYTLDLPFDAEMLSVAYTAYIAQTLSIDASSGVQASILNTPTERTVSNTTQPSLLQAEVLPLSQVKIRAVSNRDFDIQTSSNVTLQSSTENADGTITKIYQLAMPDNDTFAHFRTAYFESYTMKYMYLDPSDNKLKLIEEQILPVNTQPTVIAPPQIAGYAFDSWVLVRDGSTYSFSDKYTTSQTVIGKYEKYVAPPLTGDNSQLLFWSISVAFSMLGIGTIFYSANKKKKRHQ